MGKLLNRARMTVASAPGTGVITLGSAVAGNQSFASAGIADGDVVSYVAESGYSNGVPSVWEYGQGTYAASGTTLTRTAVQGGTSGTSPVTLTSDAQVFISPLAADIPGSRWDVVVEDQRASGTSAGASTGGTWNVRPLNTVVKNAIPGTSLASNQLTLPPGSYEIDFDALGYHAGPGHVARLYNVTDGTVVVVGSTEPQNNNYVGTRSTGRADVTLTASKAFRLDHWFYSGDGNGLGVDISSGSPNVFARLRVKRTA